jgi:hypothetical protein
MYSYASVYEECDSEIRLRDSDQQWAIHSRWAGQEIAYLLRDLKVTAMFTETCHWSVS